jgi:hypothetical protein
MANPMSAQWPTSWPKYLPFARSIPRSRGPVPNASSVNWPQSQLASLYLNPGSPSFQPYSYFKNNVPLTSIEPVYTADVPAALGPLSQRSSPPWRAYAPQPVVPCRAVPQAGAS